MRRYFAIGFFLFLLGTISVEAFAQFAPRVEDHFWRRKVINRIDLGEKINSPLIARESVYYQQYDRYAEKEGVVMSLFNGLKAGEFNAYHPDSLDDAPAFSYQKVLRRVQEFEGSYEDGFDDGFGDDEGFGEEEGDFEDFGGDMDEWGFDGEFAEGDDLGAEAGAGGGFFSGDFDPSPFENVIQIVEDRIFDKNRSDMVYDIQFIEIIWTDPGETLPEKRLCTFKYKEVMDWLDKAQWKNKYNDAEYRSMREIIELRLWNSLITDISGLGMKTKEEAEYRRQQLVELEHHLWSY
jgi:hypothetical protein